MDGERGGPRPQGRPAGGQRGRPPPGGARRRADRPARRTRRPDEEEARALVLRNSRGGRFTGVGDIARALGITEGRAWDAVGDMLLGGGVECVHDGAGRARLCEAGSSGRIMGGRRRGPGGPPRGGRRPQRRPGQINYMSRRRQGRHGGDHGEGRGGRGRPRGA